MEDERQGAKRPVGTGAWGHRAALNLADLREDRDLTQAKFAERVRGLGRPMTWSIVGKVEQGTRRIDADDLATFALALGVTPNRLLLTGTADPEAVTEVNPGREVSQLDAWRWALGEKPLDERADVGEFIAVNRPIGEPGESPSSSVTDHPELLRAIRRVAVRARKLGVPLTELTLATSYEYLTGGA